MKNIPETSSVQIQRPSFGSETEKIFDNVFDFYGTLDTAGRVLNLAGRIFEATNTNPELLIGQLFSQTVFWQSSENTPKIFENSIVRAAKGEASKLLLNFRISSDEKIAVEVSLQPINAEGKEVQIFVCAQAVTGRNDQVQHYKQESEQLLYAAENAEIGLWYWDFRDKKIYSTPRCNELFELSAYEIVTPESIRLAVHPEDRDFVDDFLNESRKKGTGYEEEFRVEYSDGRIEWLCSEGKSFLDEEGSPLRMIGVVRNITQQKIAGQELIRVNEREKKARDEAIEANRAKDFFLAFVSHELRSPLNAILGWSKILLTKQVPEDTRRNALETIERSARFQTKLINDLVDSARVASGKLRMEYHPTNLYEIIKNSYQAQKPSAESRNLEFEFTSAEKNIAVFGDAGRLQQVFGNLISNAIKFSPEGGKVSVDVETSAETVIVTVTDTGHGINPKALPTIFNQFSQGDVDQAKPNAGLGLGLSIVKILVTKHGGTVQAESEGDGKGSKFTVMLPISTAETKLPPKPVQIVETVNPRSLEGVKILIVEDDMDSREVLHLFLEQGGAIVASADSARAAFTAITGKNSELPDIIISDLAMPDEDGYSFIERVRQLDPEEGGAIPAMALSAFATVESRQKAFDSGFDQYCTKPFEPDLLIRDIAELVQKRGIDL
ncbi:MAG: response regulator [Saprospiraceae bacterium]|nr:response regulator [Pyrinomonadaceae bacterium]